MCSDFFTLFPAVPMLPVAFHCGLDGARPPIAASASFRQPALLTGSSSPPPVTRSRSSGIDRDLPVSCQDFPSAFETIPTGWPYLREPTAAAARRNGKNGFHTNMFFQWCEPSVFPIASGTGRTMRTVG
jgi:hypothetical protein